MFDNAANFLTKEPFEHRINRGFYRFGETILELNIINHKLMAKTEVRDLSWTH